MVGIASVWGTPAMSIVKTPIDIGTGRSAPAMAAIMQLTDNAIGISGKTRLMAVPVVTFGATIPALLTKQQNVARESGELLFVSSMANGVGFLLMAFVLHRSLDYGVIVLFIAGMTGLAFVVRSRFQWRPVVAAAGLFSLTVLVHQKV